MQEQLQQVHDLRLILLAEGYLVALIGYRESSESLDDHTLVLNLAFEH